jgi:citrate synthase
MLIKSMYVSPMDRMLQSEEAARRLGVKVTTLYAYVSRGLLVSHPEPGGKRSLFDLGDIERLAARSRGDKQSGSRLATITTRVTQLRDGGPFYRGRAAPELVGHHTFEEVTELLWEVEPEAALDADWSAPDLERLHLPEVADRMRVALVLCGASDPLRADLRPEAVRLAARRVIAALVDAVSPADVPGHVSIAQRLAVRLGGSSSSASAFASAPMAAVDAALILMADHELATSTMAVRLAASTRADIYDALLAGLATLAGPLHGGASQEAYDLFALAERDGAVRALNEVLRQQGRLPGFGHSIYKDEDPRFRVMLEQAEPLLSAERLALVRQVVDLAAERRIPPPNIDLALAAMSWGTGMPSDAGRTLFTVARIAGWTAHYQEELGERPLRFRARAVYSV